MTWVVVVLVGGAPPVILGLVAHLAERLYEQANWRARRSQQDDLHPAVPRWDEVSRVVVSGDELNDAKAVMVELVTRYSSDPALLDDLRYARQAATAPSGDDEPELGGEHRAQATGPWALADRLTADELPAMAECYRAGMIVRDLAEKFLISPSSVKRILRRAGARKRRRLPG